MFINHSELDGKVTFHIEGRLDTNNSPQLEEVLIPAFDHYNYIELDFADVDYISSAGLRVLLIGQKNAKSKQVKFTLINVPPVVMSVLTMTGFTEMLDVEAMKANA